MKNLIPLLLTATIVAALGGITSTLVLGCGQLKDEARATATDVIDCTKAEAAQAIETYAPTLAHVLIDNADGAGQLDWERVKDATRGYATSAARCVVAATIARFLKPPTVDPSAPQSAPLVLDPVALQAGWDALRREQFGGARFKLADADATL